ncbi:TPA: hypothetical protein ACGO1T_000854 [Streptococcus suis]
MKPEPLTEVIKDLLFENLNLKIRIKELENALEEKGNEQDVQNDQ